MHLASPQGGAASVADVGLRPSAIAANLGRFGGYCPVSWARAHKLKRGAEGRADHGLALCAEFRGQLYVCAGEAELCAFLARPVSFLKTHKLPADLPEPSLEEGLEVGCAGFCPVTLRLAAPGLSYERRVKVGCASAARCAPCSLQRCGAKQSAPFTMWPRLA